MIQGERLEAVSVRCFHIEFHSQIINQNKVFSQNIVDQAICLLAPEQTQHNQKLLLPQFLFGNGFDHGLQQPILVGFHSHQLL